MFGELVNLPRCTGGTSRLYHCECSTLGYRTQLHGHLRCRQGESFNAVPGEPGVGCVFVVVSSFLTLNVFGNWLLKLDNLEHELDGRFDWKETNNWAFPGVFLKALDITVSDKVSESNPVGKLNRSTLTSDLRRFLLFFFRSSFIIGGFHIQWVRVMSFFCQKKIIEIEP